MLDEQIKTNNTDDWQYHNYLDALADMYDLYNMQGSELMKLRFIPFNSWTDEQKESVKSKYERETTRIKRPKGQK